MPPLPRGAIRVAMALSRDTISLPRDGYCILSHQFCLMTTGAGGRALSTSRAAMPPTGLSMSAPQRHSLPAGRLDFFCPFSDLASRFERIFTRFCALCLSRRRRLREGAQSMGPGLGARLQLWPFGGVVTIFASRTFLRRTWVRRRSWMACSRHEATSRTYSSLRN